MESVGVEAVVTGLLTFLNSMGKMDSSIKSLSPGGTLLSRTFTGLGNVISGLISGVFRVLEYTLGNLLAGAIRAVVSQIRELISTTIEAGSEFQSLEIRLRNLNLNALIESGMEYNAATTESIKLTREQLTWLQKLAIQTPYDASDIANVFTLARSYGFAADQAQGLTEDISNFAAGMGLGNQEIERIIVNFGQMVQQGKVSGRELVDLARGSFVPVNDILDMMREKTGLTGAEFDDFRNSGEGVTMFMESFSELVRQRFADSAETMARTFSGATANVKDFIKSLIGLNIVKPILDVVGGKIADFTSALTSGDRWERFVAIASQIGKVLSEIVTGIFDLGPSADTIAERMIHAFASFSKWLTVHKDDIIAWVKSSVEWIKGTLIPAFMSVVDWVSNKLIPAIVNDLWPLILSLIPLGKALAGVFAAMFAGAEPVSFTEFIHGTLIPAIEKLTIWINKNRDTIAVWVKIFLIAFVAASLIVGAIVAIIGVLLSLATTFASLGIVIFAFAVTAMVAIEVFFIKSSILFTQWVSKTVSTVAAWSSMVIGKISSWATSMIAKFKGFVTNAKALDWKGIGAAIIDGIVGYVQANIGKLASTLAAGIAAAIAAAKNALLSGSPSRVFMAIGKSTMDGFAMGVMQNIGSVEKTMQRAVGRISMPAFAAPSMAFAGAMAPSSTTSNTVNYNNTLNVNTNARHEPIVQDFAMMQSLSGG